MHENKISKRKWIDSKEKYEIDDTCVNALEDITLE